MFPMSYIFEYRMSVFMWDVQLSRSERIRCVKVYSFSLVELKTEVSVICGQRMWVHSVN